MAIYGTLVGLLTLLTLAATRPRWCQTYETVCPPALPNTTQWICAGTYQLDCIDLQTTDNIACFPGTATVFTRHGRIQQTVSPLSFGPKFWPC